MNIKMKLTALFLILLMITGCQDNHKEPFQVGIGATNITPPVGYAHYQGVSTGVRDSLYAKALVFRQGDQQGALLICNVIGIPRSLSRHIRQVAAKETGIPFRNISIAATHTHTGPSFNEPLQAYLEHEAAGKLSPEEQKGYIAFLIQGMTEAINAANKHVNEAVIKSGVGHASSISFNCHCHVAWGGFRRAWPGHQEKFPFRKYHGHRTGQRERGVYTYAPGFYTG